MRTLILGLTIIVGVAAAFIAERAYADPYKWCAFYTDDRGSGGYNCGFISFEQCRDTIRGVGGFCGPNPNYNGVPFYTGDERPPRRTRKHPPT